MNFRLIHFAFVLLLIASCKDEKPDPLPVLPDPEAPEVNIPHIAGSRAVLQASYIGTLKQEPQIGSYTFYEGVAHARFQNDQLNPASVKQVICEGHLLEREMDIYYGSTNNAYGIDFGSTVIWEVKGSSDIPDFTYEVDYKVPEIGDLNVRDSINTLDSLWLRIDTQNPFTILGKVDSVNFSVIGKQAVVNLSVIDPKDSVVISPGQLTQCGKGMAYLKAEAIYIQKKSYQGYPVAFVNKGMFYKPVWLY